MKMTSVRSQDQRRMLQANSHTFPTNAWIHIITTRKESDRCDLCKALWVAEGRFKTEKDVPEQTLGHIQHTCEALSAAHMDAHHQCWRLIHGELDRLASPEWKFLCISGEKCLQTIWNEIPSEIEDLRKILHRTQYGMLQEPERWIDPSHREKPEESKRTNQRKQ